VGHALLSPRSAAGNGNDCRSSDEETTFFREKVMSFEAVWGFDPEEALRAQNALRQGSVPRCDAWVEEVYIRPYDEVRIPQSENSQVYELRRLFRL